MRFLAIAITCLLLGGCNKQKDDQPPLIIFMVEMSGKNGDAYSYHQREWAFKSERWQDDEIVTLIKYSN